MLKEISMATLEYSPDFLHQEDYTQVLAERKGMIERIIHGCDNLDIIDPARTYFWTNAGLLPNKYSPDRNPWRQRVLIMKGDVPTSFDTLYPQLASHPTRPGGDFYEDVLIDFGNQITTSIVGNTIYISANSVAATGTGTATWFWIQPCSDYQYDNHGSNIGVEIMYASCFGTVGSTGSGADLEVPNTNIEARAQYFLRNLKISFPRIFTY